MYLSAESGTGVDVDRFLGYQSSGYQSFATYSPSSSPVDPTISSSGQEATNNAGYRLASFRQTSVSTSPTNPSTATSPNNNNNNEHSSAAIAFTNPIYNLRTKATTPLPWSYATAYGYESVLNRTPSCEDVHQAVMSVAPRVTLIANGGGCGSSQFKYSLTVTPFSTFQFHFLNFAFFRKTPCRLGASYSNYKGMLVACHFLWHSILDSVVFVNSHSTKHHRWSSYKFNCSKTSTKDKTMGEFSSSFVCAVKFIKIMHKN